MYTGGDERLQIDSSGNLLIGRTAWVDNHFDNGIYLAGGTQAGMKFMRTASGSAGTYDIGIDTDRAFKFVYAGDSGGTGTEYLRITSGGNVIINDGTLQTSYDGSSNYGAQINDSQTSGTHIQFQRQGYNNGNITHTTNSSAYNTTGSDRTLKKNFEDWNENTLDLFKSLKPQKFNFKTEDDGAEKTKGYIAQDLVDSFPEAYPKEVVSDKYMFNPSGMVPYLMKALQEEIVKREALEARIAALEGS